MGNVPEVAGKEGYNIAKFVNKKSILRPALEFIDSNYSGSISEILKGSNNVFDLLLNIRNNNTNSKAKKIMKIMKFGIPAGFMVSEFYLRLKHFMKERAHTRSTYDKHMDGICKILEIDFPGYYDGETINMRHPTLGIELVGWALNRPSTSSIKILGYYNSGTFNEEDATLSLDKEFEIIVKIEFEEFKFAWLIQIKKSFLEVPYLYGSCIYSDGKIPHDICLKFESALIIEYIRSFDIKKNVLMYDSGRITPRKRSKVIESINQINIKDLINEFNLILKNKGRRGIAFIGVQGTGKSLIIRKIEELMTNVTMLHITPERVRISIIDDTFSIIRNLQPLIVVMEDFDSFDFEEKDEKVGKFINLMDSIKNAIFLVTINDTSKVHKTIIDRPQRFDDIIEIKAPDTDDEVYMVMKSSFGAFNSKKIKSIPSKSKINKKNYEICKRNKFTQAAISSSMDRTVMLLNERKKVTCNTFNAVLHSSLVSLEKSQKALSNYKFGEEVDNYIDDSCVKAAIAAEPYPAFH